MTNQTPSACLRVLPLLALLLFLNISQITLPFKSMVNMGLTTVCARTLDQGTNIPEDELKQILQKVKQNFEQIKTLKTKLTQEKNISLFSETIISNGLCIFQSPGNIRLEFLDPFKSVLIVNNNNIYKYEFFNTAWERQTPGNKQVMKVILDHITAWMNGRFNDRGLYEVSGIYRQEKAQNAPLAVSIILTPKAKEFKQFIQGFELGISTDQTRLDHIIIHESKEDYTKINFHGEVINTTIEENVFDGSQNFPFPVAAWHKDETPKE